jgi:hypothetical protein
VGKKKNRAAPAKQTSKSPFVFFELSQWVKKKIEQHQRSKRANHQF